MSESMGKVAFDAYNAAKGGKTYEGKPIPPWDAVGDEVRAAWEVSANAVLNAQQAARHPPRETIEEQHARRARERALREARETATLNAAETIEDDGKPVYHPHLRGDGMVADGWYPSLSHLIECCMDECFPLPERVWSSVEQRPWTDAGTVIEGALADEGYDGVEDEIAPYERAALQTLLDGWWKGTGVSWRMPSDKAIVVPRQAAAV